MIKTDWIKPRTRTWLKKLQKKHTQIEQGYFFVEGRKSAARLLNAEMGIHLVAVTPSFFEKRGTVLRNYSGQVVIVRPNEWKGLARLKHNEGILVLAHRPPILPALPLQGDRILLLDNIQDPTNLGSLLRIADWFGITQLIASPNTVDCYNSKVIQTSMGSFVDVRVSYTPLLPLLSIIQRPLIGASLSGDNLHQVELPAKACLLLGNESKGIAPQLMPYLAQKIAIPAYGKAQSLNVAMAAAIFCNHWRQSV